MSKMPKIEDLS